MPEPDPPPPRPRGMSIRRWLLLLLPSVFVMAVPLVDILDGPNLVTAFFLIIMIFLCPWIPLPLCFIFGFVLEKWLHHEKRNIPRAIGYGFAVLFVNIVAAFAECAAIDAYFDP